MFAPYLHYRRDGSLLTRIPPVELIGEECAVVFKTVKKSHIKRERKLIGKRSDVLYFGSEKTDSP